MEPSLNYGPLSAGQVLSVIAELERRWCDLAPWEPRLAQAGGNKLTLVFPRTMREDRRHPASPDALDSLATAVKQHLPRLDVAPGQDLDKNDYGDDKPLLRETIGWLLGEAIRAQDWVESAAPLERERRAVLMPDNIKAEVLGTFPDLVFAAAAARVGAGWLDGELWAVALLEDDATRGSIVSALRDRDLYEQAYLLTDYATLGGRVFLPVSWTVNEGLLEAAGKCLYHLRPSVLTPGRALAVVEWDSKVCQIAFDLPKAPSDAVEAAAPTGISIQVSSLEATDGALEQLNERIGATRPAGGYRLKLVPVPSVRTRRDNVEQLSERLVELEERLALLQAQERPQLRLLRFEFDQVAAMADALVRLPVAALDMGVVRYGYQVSTENRTGVHYLLFDLAEAPQLSPFPHWIWEEENRRPLEFWLDPHAAAQDNSSEMSHIFVPDGERLEPSILSFLDESLDAYVRERLEHWVRYAGVRVDMPAAPILIFMHQDEDLSLEVLDGEAFRPIKKRLPWINDNIRLYEAVDADSFMAEAITSAGRQSLLQRLADEATGRDDTLHRRLEQLSSDLRGGLESVLSEITVEIQRTAHHISSGLVFVEELTDRLTQVENVLGQAVSDAHRASQEAHTAAEHVSDLDAYWEAVVLRYRNIVRETERFYEQTRQELADLDEKIGTLRRRMGRY